MTGVGGSQALNGANAWPMNHVEVEVDYCCLTNKRSALALNS